MPDKARCRQKLDPILVKAGSSRGQPIVNPAPESCCVLQVRFWSRQIIASSSLIQEDLLGQALKQWNGKAVWVIAFLRLRPFTTQQPQPQPPHGLAFRNRR